jgi:hypothetical protein
MVGGTTRCFCLLFAEGVRNVDVPIPAEYAQVILPLTPLTLRPAGLFTVVVM